LFLAEKKVIKDKYPQNKVKKLPDSVLAAGTGAGSSTNTATTTDLAKLK
jgi:hypothetical protein